MGTQRSWAPAAAGVISLIMVLLVLPNPLRIPQNNPTAAAEYAPVPGKTQNNANANFGETAIADSAGIGSGGVGEGLLPGGTLPPPPKQFKPRQKDCVGNPPRQTEDPLSPPCVPFFDGDNGGATYPGVTRDTIEIAYYNDFGVRGDLNRPWKPSDETAGSESDYYHVYHVRTVKAHIQYFQKRFQTYGRSVRVTGYKSGGGLGTSGSQRQGDAALLYDDLRPFAVTALIENAQEFAPMMKRFNVPTFGWNEDVPFEDYIENRPYFWSFMPDQSTETKWSASFICKKLKDRTAKFTDDPLLKGTQRKFGLLWLDKAQSQRGPFLDQLANLLIEEVKKQCNMTFDITKTFTGNGEASGIMSQFKREGITTVVCYCIAQINELHVPAFQNAANGMSYFPEWFWDSTAAMDRGLWQQEYGSRNQKGFGPSYLWRQPEFYESYAYKAYLESFPDTAPNPRFNLEIYHVFLNLFSAIQAAGPKLTPETVERGMFTFKYQNPLNPWVPTGGYGLDSPSPYTFVDTAMGWWWDPTGQPPGGDRGEGCIRVMYEGRRFRWNEWPEGDEDMFNPSDPCTEDTRQRIESGRPH